MAKLAVALTHGLLSFIIDIIIGLTYTDIIYTATKYNENKGQVINYAIFLCYISKRKKEVLVMYETTDIC